MTRTLLIFGLTILFRLSAIAQDNSEKGPPDYPASIKLDKEYNFSITSDSINQKVTIRATGNKEIWYGIIVTTKVTGVVGGQDTQYYSGVAKWDHVRSLVTDRGDIYDKWSYKTLDNLLMITLYEEGRLKLSLENAKLAESIMELTK